MRIKLTIISAFFLALLLQQSALATPQVQTTVSNNSVFLGDFFTLSIEINGNDSDFQLDSRPLEKDFNVSHPAQSRSSSYINGKSSAQTQWQITLQAKHLGELTIPALKIGDLRSTPIEITVKKPSAKATKTADDLIFMENSLDKSSVYIGQPLLFTSKIYIAQNSNDLNLLAPSLEGANVTIFGDDKNGQTIRNNIRYHTITRQYQINASKAGSFIINSPLLTGNSKRMVNLNNWQNQVSQPINIRGDGLKIIVKGKPANYQGEWLVSDEVRLLEDTPLTKQSYHVGDPITRSITLQVASIDINKLPTIHFNYPKSLRFYPDQDELKEGQANGVIYAQRTMRHAIIADHPGKLTLPEIKLPWWNSQTDKQEFAVLPAQTLTILAAEKTAENITVNKLNTPPTATKQPPATTAPATVIADNNALIYWQIACALLLFVLIILTFYHIVYRRSQRRAKSTPPLPPFNQSYAHLLEALENEQPTMIHHALLTYAQNDYPALKSLSQWSGHLHLSNEDKKQLSAAIKALGNACANPAITWDSSQLSRLIEKIRVQKKIHLNKDIMNINPS